MHTKDIPYFTTARTIKNPVGDHPLEITDSVNPFFQACLTHGKNTGRIKFKKKFTSNNIRPPSSDIGIALRISLDLNTSGYWKA